MWPIIIDAVVIDIRPDEQVHAIRSY